MKRYFLLILALFVLVGCKGPREEVWLVDMEQIPVSAESSTSDPAWYTDEPLDFGDYFELAGEVQLSDDIVFGSRTSLIVGPQGQFLMLDSERDQAGLFDKAGNLLANVSPEACHPGFDFKPMKAFFLPDGGFLVLTFMAQGFWFDANGACTTKLPHRPYSSIFALSADSSLFASRVSQDSWHLLRFGTEESQVDTLFTGIPTRLSFRFVGGGLVQGAGNDWYLAGTHSPFVYRYRDGRFEKMGYIPSYYTPVQEDLTTEEQQNVDALMERLSDINRSSSATGWLYQLDEELLVLRYMRVDDDGSERPNPGALHIMDFDGNPITHGPLFLGELNPFYFANGSMYLSEYDQSGLDDAPLNPKIIEYRFIGR